MALLAIVGMLGACLLLTARLDRQTTQATAEATQANYVVDSVLSALLADRLADLHVSAQGIAYGALDANPATAERQCIDYPDEACDPALASIEPTRGHLEAPGQPLPGRRNALQQRPRERSRPGGHRW